MAIVVALLGAMFCGAALTPLIVRGSLDHIGEVGPAGPGEMFGVPLYGVLFGGALVVCGLVLTTAFGLAAKRPALGNLVLVFGTLVAVLGVFAAVVAYHTPFSWMTAIVGLAIFIDALCLRIVLSQKN